MLFEALALSLCQELPVRQAAQMLRMADKQLLRRSEHDVEQARARRDVGKVRIVGMDETRVCRCQQYITVDHDDLAAKRQRFATSGRDHSTVGRFAQDLAAHGGQREHVHGHECGLRAGRCYVLAAGAD